MEYLALNKATYDRLEGMNDLESLQNYATGKNARKRIITIQSPEGMSRKIMVSEDFFLKRLWKNIKKVHKKPAELLKKSITSPIKVIKAAREAKKSGGNVKQAIKEAARDEGKAQKQLVKDTAKAAIAITKDVTIQGMLSPLIPLIPMMQSLLKKIGMVPPSRKDPDFLKNIAVMFWKYIIRSKKYPVPQQNTLEHYMYKQDLTINDLDEDHAAPAIAAVVVAVLGFVKAIMIKKKQGQKLTKTEEFIATNAEQVKAQIIAEAENEAALQAGTPFVNFGKKIIDNPFISFAVAGVVAYLLFFHKW